MEIRPLKLKKKDLKIDTQFIEEKSLAELNRILAEIEY